MSNRYEIYSREIREDRVKAFISELRKRKFYICDCNECHSAQKDIVSLSYKIANQLDHPEELSEKENIEAIDNFAINLGSCILRPSYLLNYGKWKRGDLVDCYRSNYMFFLVDLICDSDHLVSYGERIQFGERIDTIKRSFLCEGLYHYSGDGNRSIGARLRIHDDKTTYCQNNGVNLPGKVTPEDNMSNFWSVTNDTEI